MRGTSFKKSPSNSPQELLRKKKKARREEFFYPCMGEKVPRSMVISP
jgi:hypothetical protein